MKTNYKQTFSNYFKALSEFLIPADNNMPEYVEKVKAEIKQLIQEDDKQAPVGRVEDWLNSTDSRYPVSCTVLSVEDSMEGENGIEYSWAYVSKALRFAAGVAVDLSKLRGKGVDNGKGLVSSGAVSFMTIYSKLNEVLRRGGTFKNGAVVCYLDAYHPDIEEFLDILPSEIPWAKRAIYIDAHPDSEQYILKHTLLDKILDKVRDGSIWLSKKVWKGQDGLQHYPINYLDIWEGRLFTQVCTEIVLPSNGTCLLHHVNLGKCKPEQLEKALCDAVHIAGKLHAITGAGRDNYYKTPDEDKQIGVGVIGLANFLTREGITYKEFAECLSDRFSNKAISTKAHRKEVWKVVFDFSNAFYAASQVAKSYGMERAFTIAPTATMSYRYTDLDGYTTTPEISPPICHPVTTPTTRDSGTFGVKEYQYPTTVETAEEVGFNTYFLLCDAWQMLMNIDGLGHAISHNVWNECPVNRIWLYQFLQSSLITTYYRMQVAQSFVDKTSVETGGVEIDLDAEEGFFMPDEQDTEKTNDNPFSNFFSFTRTEENTDNEQPVNFCGLKPGECSGCDGE